MTNISLYTDISLCDVASTSATTAPSSHDLHHDVIFVVPPPDDLLCTICLVPANDATVTEECGHLFCRECITLALQQKKECPMCRSPCTAESIHKDIRSQRKIRELVVYCPNRPQGCQWQGSCSDAERHGAKCEYVVTPCPFKSHGCTVRCTRQSLAAHLEKDLSQHLLYVCSTVARLAPLQEEVPILSQKVEILQRQDKDKQYLWIVPHFDTKKGAIYSPKFMQRGCSWYLGVDGEGPDHHAGVYLFADGHKSRIDFKLTLFHSDPAKDKLHMVSDWRQDYKGKGWGPLKFIDRANIQGSGFLVNGCIRIGLKMETDAYD